MTDIEASAILDEMYCTDDNYSYKITNSKGEIQSERATANDRGDAATTLARTRSLCTVGLRLDQRLGPWLLDTPPAKYILWAQRTPDKFGELHWGSLFDGLRTEKLKRGS